MTERCPTPAEIRARVAAACSAVARSREVAHLVDLGGGEGEERLHEGYVVEDGGSVPFADRRQRRSAGVMVWTTLRIRWARELRAGSDDDEVADRDTAGDLGLELLRAALAVDRTDTAGIELVARGAPRVGSGWYMGDITIRVAHRLDLGG